MHESPRAPEPGTPDSSNGFPWGKALAAAGAVILALDHTAERVRSSAKPTITEIPRAPGAPANRLHYVNPGFNSHAEAASSSILPVLQRVGRVALPQLSRSYYNPENDFQALREHVLRTDTDELILDGKSLGGFRNLRLAARFRSDPDLQHVKVALLFDSSPFAFEHVKGTARRKALRFLAAADGKYPGGPIERFGLEMMGHMIDNPQSRNPMRSFGHALGKALDPKVPCNRQCLGAAHDLYTSDNTPLMEALEEVPMVYVGAGDPRKDTIVDQKAAHAWLQDRHRAFVPFFGHPDIGHANPGAVPGAYEEILPPALESLRMPLAA